MNNLQKLFEFKTALFYRFKFIFISVLNSKIQFTRRGYIEFRERNGLTQQAA